MRSSITRRPSLAAAAGAMANESFPHAPGADQAASNDRVRIVTGLRATNQSLGWIGTEAGIFRRLGLKVAFPRLETGGPEAAAGLIRGDWEFAETGSSPLIQGVLNGHDTVILLTPTAPSPTGTTIILARPGISKPSQLTGMRIGVLTESGQTTISLRVSLRTWDVTATLVPLGTFGKIYAALGSGGIDAGTLPFDYRFLGPREFELNVIETPSTGFSPAAVGCTRRLIIANRSLVARLVQGYVETIHLFKTRRADAIPLLQRFLAFQDRAAVEAAYDFYVPRFQSLPRPFASGVQTLLNEMAVERPAAGAVSLAAVVDGSFLDELERVGFVRNLYAR